MIAEDRRQSLLSKMHWNDSSGSSQSDNEAHSAFTQTEHNIVAAYLITAVTQITRPIEKLWRWTIVKYWKTRYTLQCYHTICRRLLPEKRHAWGFKKREWKRAIGVISIFSNIVVLGIFVKYKELRTATNAIIINLAFTDIGVSGIGYPMSAASDLHGSWKFGYTGCQIYAALNIFFGMASIGLLTVVAVDRYLTICRPDIGRRMTTRTYATLILAAWINAIFWASMPIVGWAGYAPDPTGATCTVNWRKNDASFVSYTMSVIAVNFVVPLTVMFYCYYNVSRTMKKYTSSNCLESINTDWSDQVDVTKIPTLWWILGCTSFQIYMRMKAVVQLL
nr:visual pigment-like receptor peropsin isoform X3 [Anser cygnoides]